MNIVLIINIFTIVNLTVLGVVLLQKRPHTLHNIVLSVLVFIPAVAVLFNTLLYYDLADDFSITLFLTFNLNMITDHSLKDTLVKGNSPTGVNGTFADLGGNTLK